MFKFSNYLCPPKLIHVHMYAIVEIAGLQYKVQKDQRVYVHRLEGNEGDKVKFDRVLLTEQNSIVSVGAPVIEDATVTASILAHVKADKVIIFKKKRRKGYEKKTGHRQPMTQITITDIKFTASKTSTESDKKAAVKPKVQKSETVKKAVSKVEKKVSKKSDIVGKVPSKAPKKSTKKAEAAPKAAKDS